MQFINPLNNKIQTCNINIYNEHKIKKNIFFSKNIEREKKL